MWSRTCVPPVTSPCVKFTALFSLGGPCKAGGLKSGSLISPQIRAPGTREALSLGLIHTFCEEKGIAPVSGGCAAAGPAGAAKAVPWEGECPRAAEESQGSPRDTSLGMACCPGRAALGGKGRGAGLTDSTETFNNAVFKQRFPRARVT